jgi:hypothetical protein
MKKPKQKFVGEVRKVATLNQELDQVLSEFLVFAQYQTSALALLRQRLLRGSARKKWGLSLAGR